jgi:ribulose 1,5-bisphosphate synthetase/thiazole synthase
MNQKWYHSLKAFLIVFSGFFLLGPAWSQDSHFEVNSMNEAHRKQSDTLAVDILISGGTLSAPAAALQAARSNPEAKILLIEPTAWLGGQATSQGVSAIDNTWFNPGATLMRENP